MAEAVLTPRYETSKSLIGPKSRRSRSGTYHIGAKQIEKIELGKSTDALVVLSDPPNNGGQVVLVRVRTDDGNWPDRDYILEPADWMELEHRSTIAYSTAKFGPVLEKLEQAVQRPTFRTISSPSIDTLRKMSAAGRTAKGMPPGAVRWLDNLPDTTPLVSPASKFTCYRPLTEGI